MNRLPRNLKEKEKIGFWLLNPASKIESLLLTLFFLLLPTQFGKHFWPDVTLVSGIRIDYLSPIIYVTDILLVLLLGFFVFRWIKSFNNSKIKNQNSKAKLKSKKYFIVAGLVVFFICNIIFSSRPPLGFYGFVKLCEYASFSFYLAKTTRSVRQLQQIAFLFSISAFFESLLAVLQYVNQGSLNGIFYFFGERTFTGVTPGIANASINGTLILRPYATFPHPNVLAGYLLFAMVFTWSFIIKNQNRWMRVFATISLLVSSIALLLTYSRVAILLWILGFVTLLFITGVYKIKTVKVKIIFLAVAVIILAIISFFPLTHQIIDRFIHTSLSEESVTERTELLSASWMLIQQHLLIGVGLLNFIPSLAPLQKPLPLGLYLQPVHNIFVLVAAETGVIGLGLFIWLLAATTIRIKNYELRIRGTFFVLFLIVFATGFFDHYWLTLQQGQLLFSTVIGLSWAKFQTK